MISHNEKKKGELQEEKSEIVERVRDESTKESLRVIREFKNAAEIRGEALQQVYNMIPSQDSVYWPKWDTFEIY